MCMCAFWAVCFVVWLVIGSIHVSRAVNAEKINKDYNQFNLISSQSIKNRGEPSDTGNIYASAAKEAYDSCIIPRYEQDPNISDAEILAVSMEYFDYCGLDT